MRGSGAELSGKQLAAIEALLSEPSLAAAARKVDVNESTLRRWQKQPAFAAALAAARAAEVRNVASVIVARKDLLARAVDQAMGLYSDALAALKANLAAERPADQIRAAAIIVTAALNLQERGDLEERMRDLEARVAGAGAPAALTSLEPAQQVKVS